MTWSYERLARRYLFRMAAGDAEAAKQWVLRRAEWMARHPASLAPARARFAVADPVTVFGVRFANRVGLGAGLDKDGIALPAWPAFGFGFVEVGTVTWHAQPGNERPRVFRLPDSEAIINRMGFNNEGAGALAERLRAMGKLTIPVGVSIGKSAVAPLEEAVVDYLASLRILRPYADYVAINVSSPNTPGLRRLQGRAQLHDLLSTLVSEANGLPVLVKISPDLTDDAIDDVLEVCQDRSVAGVIATNTTTARDGLAPSDARSSTAREFGGMSGRPLAARARSVVAYIHRHTEGRLPIIGVGGIFEPVDAARMQDAGADLVQLYSGLIYRGPGLTRRVAAALRDRTQGRVPLAPGSPGRQPAGRESRA